MVGVFALKVDPAEKIIFEGKGLGKDPVVVSLKVTNPDKEKAACKVKCTSNELFRIRPPVFFLDGEKTATVSLTFAGGSEVPANGLHHFNVYYIKGTGGNARECWKAHKGDPDGTKKMPVEFNKEGGDAAAKDDKGAAEKKDEKEPEKKEEKEEKKEDKKEDEKKEEEKKEGEDKKESSDKKDEEKKEGEEKKESKKEEGEDKKEEEKKEGEEKKDEEKEGAEKEEGGE